MKPVTVPAHLVPLWEALVSISAPLGDRAEAYTIEMVLTRAAEAHVAHYDRVLSAPRYLGDEPAPRIKELRTALVSALKVARKGAKE